MPVIRRVAVLGAGTMGAAIAALCANAGLEVFLLDLPPDHLTSEEEAAGLTLANPAVRNRLVRTGLARTMRARPPAFVTSMTADRVTVGNVADDLDWVGKADWIIEAVVERLDAKQHLLAQVDSLRRADSVVSSNTSGIPLHQIADGRSAGFQAHFLGTHFFNPPRYLKLLELIPTAATAPAIVDNLRQFAEGTLGKRVVLCKDTPGFIANRIGVYASVVTMRYALEQGYGIEEVDALSGPLIGRPKTATFRLADLAGLDIMAGVARDLQAALPNDAWGAELPPPELERLVAASLTGTKANGGFYRRRTGSDGSATFDVVDLETLEYRPAVQPHLPLVEEVGGIRDLPARLQAILARAATGDRQATLVEAALLPMLAYAASCVPEISDDLPEVDGAMRWGYGHTLGPFQTWQALGVAFTAERLRSIGRTVAPWIADLLARGQDDLYRRVPATPQVYQPLERRYGPLRPNPAYLDLADLKAAGKLVIGNAVATIVDLADGVLCLEFHSKANSIGEETLGVLEEALDLLAGNDWQALVIGNQGDYFSAGVNLAELAALSRVGDGSSLETFLVRVQRLVQRVRFSLKPVVAAPFGQTLGLGLELCLACAGVCAEGDSAMGLVEVGVGLIPAGGGCKELVRRLVSPRASQLEELDSLPALRRVLWQVMQTKVSGSAAEARKLGYLTDHDRIILGQDQLLAAAKRLALDLAAGYRPPDSSRTCYAAGKLPLAALGSEIDQARSQGELTEHEATIASTLSWVLCGGDRPEAGWTEEAELLALERQVFARLLAEEKTQLRIAHLLRTRERLRN